MVGERGKEGGLWWMATVGKGVEDGGVGDIEERANQYDDGFHLRVPWLLLFPIKTS